ncbi:nucleotidyltransferase domain-containing protein [Azospirillum thiophilum]|uniref:nucleotidyltransferase domain-containing protein n=1 Tax=Azospirillum thiophilum TaxID=528244 RepID=UPI00069680C4|nr:nucleotidyltransferase domain-containing protein [Azospirillum thiophilum]
MTDDGITGIIRDAILTSNVDKGAEPVTLQEVLESGILAEVRDPDAVMQQIADRLAAEIAARLEGVIPPAEGAVAAAPVGSFRNEEAAIGFLRDRLVAALKPRMVWLFGSRARCDARMDSDFDVLLVLSDDGLPERACTSRAVVEPLVACGLGYNVVPCSWSVFLAEREQSGTLVHRAIREGRLLYQDCDLHRDPTPAEIVAASRQQHLEINRGSMAKALKALDFWGATDEQAKAILGAALHGVLLGRRSGIGIEAALDDADISSRLRAMTVIINHLGQRYGEPADILAWMRSPCEAFEGKAPLKHMASGRLEDLEEVRVYLQQRASAAARDR